MTFLLPVRGFSRRGFRVNQDSKVNYATTAVVDFDDERQLRILRSHRGMFFTSPTLELELRKDGGASTGAFGQVVVPRVMKVKEVVATLRIGPIGSTFIVDVHRVASGGLSTDAGTTIFTTQSRRPTISVGVAAVTAVNEIQTITESGAVSAGNFTITFSGQTTTALQFNDSNATILAALNALSNVAPGDIVLGGGPINTNPVTLTFEQAYAATDVPQITIDNTNLVGGTYVPSTTTAGVAGVTAVNAGLISLLDATNGVPQVTDLAAGDILRAEIDQVGSGTAGSDLKVYIRMGLV